MGDKKNNTNNYNKKKKYKLHLPQGCVKSLQACWVTHSASVSFVLGTVLAILQSLTKPEPILPAQPLGQTWDPMKLVVGHSLA